MDPFGITLFIGSLVAIALAARTCVLGIEPHDIWSINIYRGVDPIHVGPHPSHVKRPALQSSDVNDIRALFVADPFLVRDGPQWWMFLEVLNKDSRRGEVAVASSRDGIAWRYDRVVLREPFHLSYPYVFEADGTYYMIPETGQAGAVRLYRAVSFPYEWQFEQELLSGKYVDASILQFDGRWWLFAQRDGRALTLHCADRLAGPWKEHPASPIAQDDVGVTRPGGRIIVWDGRILRFSQDGGHTYGRRLRAFQIEELTTHSYRERELAESPVLDASGRGWNADGMHHLDAQQVRSDLWIAAVDGKRIGKRLNWRLGLRRLGDWRSADRS